jgi:hypothetical protein
LKIICRQPPEKIPEKILAKAPDKSFGKAFNKSFIGETRPAEETKTLSKDEPVILCIYCNQQITDPSRQINVNNAFQHVFANPNGHVFEIGCFSEAKGCVQHSISSNEFSWFTGFSWQISVCSYCSNHLGWFFSSESKSFYALIMDRIIFP